MARRQIAILAGPITPPTLSATLPLVTYVFDRLLAELEGEGLGSVTLAQVSRIVTHVCAEHGSPHLTKACQHAVDAALFALTFDPPLGMPYLRTRGNTCRWRDSNDNLWMFSVDNGRIRIQAPEKTPGQYVEFTIPARMRQ